MTTLLSHPGTTARPGALRGAAAAPSARAGNRWRIPLRTDADVECIAAAGVAVRAALDAAVARCVPGATTASLEAAAREALRAAGADALFLGYPAQDAGCGPAAPFPAVTCISVNEELVHGIPGPRRLEDGDVVSIDCGARVNGWCADAAVTVVAGRPDAAGAALVAATARVLEVAIGAMAPGIAWSRIAAAMGRAAFEAGYDVVTGYLGHGIGRSLHEAPEVPNHVGRMLRTRDDFTLLPGMVLGVEPMLVAAAPGVAPRAGVSTRTLADGWTVVVADGRPSAHVEHTIAVTRSGARVLTGPHGPAYRAFAAHR